MAKNWWKILTITLILSTVYFSLKTPLAPGLIATENSRVFAGDSLFTAVNGFATWFTKENEALTAWITPTANPNQEIVCLAVEVVSATTLNISGAIPENWVNQNLDLYIKSDFHGSMALFFAFFAAEQRNVEFPKSVPVEFCNPGNTVTIPPFFNFSFKTILYETIRNINFHVPMFFAMMFLMTLSLIYSIQHLSKGTAITDLKAGESIMVALFFAILGLATGSLWAKFTWGAWWVNDTKLNGTAISVLIYLAYIVLRNSVSDLEKRGRLAAVYNIFAYVLMMVFIMVLPRLTDSLHPGNGGNPAFSNYDLDNNLRLIFYPAVLGWILLSYWIFQIKYRLETLKNKINND
ncbi:MAG: cytochrome c biogenesis protein CcsA [Luteibaculaceae bacterium]